MTGREDLPMLEALLARVQMRARMPHRHVPRAPEPMARPIVVAPQILALSPATLPLPTLPLPTLPLPTLPLPTLPLPTLPLPTLPPTPDARAAIETEVMKHTPAPEAVAASATRILAAQPLVPAESRAQLVGEAKDEIVEIEETELLSADSAPSDEIFVDEDVELPPPSSKRPIPMEDIAESQKDQPVLPPPPESGKLIATVPAFDDDFTGVREASHQLPPLGPNEPPLELQPMEPPKRAVADALEVEISTAPVANSDVAPVAPATEGAPSRFRPVAPSFHPERTHAKLPSGQATVVVEGAVASFVPTTFGEMLDASLAL